MLEVEKVLQEAVHWLTQTPEGRAVPQVNGQPGEWMNKAIDELASLKGKTLVKEDDLKKWLAQIKADRQFRIEVQQDLLEVKVMLDMVTNSMAGISPTKIAMQIIQMITNPEKNKGLFDVNKLLTIINKYTTNGTEQKQQLGEHVDQ